MSSSTAEVTEQVNTLMHEVFEIPRDKLHADAKLFDDLSLDSLDAVDMMVHLEDKIGFKVDAEKFRNVRQLGDVYQVVTELVAEKNNPTKVDTTNFIDGMLNPSANSQPEIS